MSSSAALIVPPSTSTTSGLRGVAARVGVQGALLAVDVVRGDQAAVEEGGGGGDGLGDQAAGVAAQVEEDPGVAGAPRRTAARTASPEPLVNAATLIDGDAARAGARRSR